MKSLILKTSKNHPSHIVYESKNSFGDQILTLRVEAVDGSVREFEQVNGESNHVPFTPAAMAQAFSFDIERG